MRLSSGGGTRKLDVGSHFTKEMLIEEGKKLFYPNGKSSQGLADDMIFDLANFKEESIDILYDGATKQPFTVQKYIEMNKPTQVRLCLKTKSTSFPDVDGFGDNDDEEPAAHIKTSRSDNEEKAIDSASDDETLMHPIFDSGTTPDASSEERLDTIKEQDRLFQESLDNDRRKENKSLEAKETEENERNRLEQLRQARLERVPPEPHPDHPRVRIAVNHISKGKIVRSFSVNNNMQAVYDWAGSVAHYPEHFYLSLCKGQAIMPSDPVANVAKCTLYMEVSASPVAGFGHHEEVIMQDIISNTTR